MKDQEANNPERCRQWSAMFISIENLLIHMVLALFIGKIIFTPDVFAANNVVVFESPPMLSAADVLTPGLLSSPNHRVQDEIQFDDQFFRFKLETDHGTETVISRALLRIRIHEATAIVEASRALSQHTEDKMSDGLSRMYQSTSQSVQPDNFSNDPGAKVDYPQLRLTGKKKKPPVLPGGDEHAGGILPMSNDPVLVSHKRAVAAKLQLDVYSSNPHVQDILDQLALERVQGKTPLGASFFLERDPETRLSRGLVDAEVRRELKDKTPEELRDMNAEILTGLGIPMTDRQQFLTHPAFTPRHTTFITAYLKRMENTKGSEKFFAAVLNANNEIEALYFEQLSRMLAIYNEQVKPLASFGLSGTTLVAKTTSGILVLAQPVDMIYWSQDFSSLIDSAGTPEDSAGLQGQELLVTGIVTNTVRNRLEKLGFLIRDNFLARR